MLASIPRNVIKVVLVDVERGTEEMYGPLPLNKNQLYSQIRSIFSKARKRRDEKMGRKIKSKHVFFDGKNDNPILSKRKGCTDCGSE
jgi:hypothetical protein